LLFNLLVWYEVKMSARNERLMRCADVSIDLALMSTTLLQFYKATGKTSLAVSTLLLQFARLSIEDL
jgi:hypothetical protein